MEMVINKNLKYDESYSHIRKGLYNLIFYTKDEFLNELKKSLEINSKNFIAIELLDKYNNYPELLELIKNIIEKNNLDCNHSFKDFISYLNGVYLLIKSKYNEAELIFNTLINKNPELLEEHILLAFCYNKSKKSEKALEITNRCLKLFPENEWIYIHNFIALNQLGNSTQADELLKKAIDLFPNSAALHTNIGYFLLQKREIEDGIKHLQKAMEITPNIPGARQNMLFGLKLKNKLYLQYLKLWENTNLVFKLIFYIPAFLIEIIFMDFFYLNSKIRPFISLKTIIVNNFLLFAIIISTYSLIN